MAPHHLSAVPWLLFLAATAAAQPAAVRPDPADPQADVPPLRHETVFRHYRRTADAARIDWKQANETVARIGGWRAYAREAAAAPPAPGPAHDAMHGPMHRQGTRPGDRP